jgi:hypothetical protein
VPYLRAADDTMQYTVQCRLSSKSSSINQGTRCNNLFEVLVFGHEDIITIYGNSYDWMYFIHLENSPSGTTPNATNNQLLWQVSRVSRDAVN